MIYPFFFGNAGNHFHGMSIAASEDHILIGGTVTSANSNFFSYDTPNAGATQRSFVIYFDYLNARFVWAKELYSSNGAFTSAYQVAIDSKNQLAAIAGEHNNQQYALMNLTD